MEVEVRVPAAFGGQTSKYAWPWYERCGIAATVMLLEVTLLIYLMSNGSEATCIL